MSNRIVSLLRLACFALCAVCFPLSSYAATWYVATTGSDSNPGTAAQPFQTIQQAVNTASGGDTVLVADGTYIGTGNYNVAFGVKNLIVQSVSGNPATCIIDCQKAGCAFILRYNQTANSSISGFTIANGTGYLVSGATYGGGIYISMDDTNPVVSNCVFIGNSATNQGGGMYYGTALNCVFTSNKAQDGGGMLGGIATNCLFTGNSSSNGIGGGMLGGIATNCVITGNTAGNGGGGGMAFATATNCIFAANSATLNGGGGMFYVTALNCVLYGNSATGQHGFGGGAYSGNLYFCAVANNYAAQGGGGIYMDSTYNTVTNCIVYGNTSGASAANLVGPGAVTYCDVQGGFSGAGNINADPLFVNQTTDNLHLKTGSPCINMATATAPLGGVTGAPFGLAPPTTDGDGGKRTVGAKPDMGAYEYGNVGIYGTLNFDGISTLASAQNVTFQFRPVGGGSAIPKTYFTTSDGAFYLYGVPDGSYNLWVKSPTYLATVVPVTVTGGAVNGITARLEPGDCNNDNICDPTDFGIFVGAYNSSASVPGSGYDPTADFNGDGIIDATDFGLFVSSYGQQGAP